MKAELFKVKNLRFLVAVTKDTEVVGFGMNVLQTEGEPFQDFMGMFDLFREPLSSTIKTKLGFKLEIVNGKPLLIDNHGDTYDYKFFEKMQNDTKKKLIHPIETLPPAVQAYMHAQIKDFDENIVKPRTEPKVQTQPTPVAQPTPVVQQPQSTGFNPRPDVVQQATQPVRAEETINVTPPPTPTPQPTPMPTIQKETPQVQQPTPRQNGKIISTDDFPRGTIGAYSVIDPTVKLPEYMDDVNGVKVYGPEKLTEEECVALSQIKKIIGRSGEHLLTDDERVAFESAMAGRDRKGGEDESEVSMGLNAIALIQTDLINKINVERRAKRNTVQLRDGLITSLKTGVPYDIAGTRFSFKYMTVVDENGEPLENKGHPLLRERVKQMKEHGKVVNNQIKIPTPQVTPTQLNRPTPPTQANPTPQTTANTATPFTPGLPFQQPAQQQAQSSQTLTCIIRKFLSTDGETIEGIMYDADGTLQNKPVSGRYIQSLAKLQSSLSGVNRFFRFTNAQLVMVSGKLEIQMTDAHLNQIDIVPAKRFIHPADVQAKVLLNNDPALDEMLKAPRFEAKENPETPVAPTPVVAPTTAPVETTQPQNGGWTPEVMDKVVEQQVASAPQPQTREVSETAKNFLEFVKNQHGKISITGILNGSIGIAMIDADELKQLLNI